MHHPSDDYCYQCEERGHDDDHNWSVVELRGAELVVGAVPRNNERDPDNDVVLVTFPSEEEVWQEGPMGLAAAGALVDRIRAVPKRGSIACRRRIGPRSRPG